MRLTELDNAKRIVSNLLIKSRTTSPLMLTTYLDDPLFYSFTFRLDKVDDDLGFGTQTKASGGASINYVK